MPIVKGRNVLVFLEGDPNPHEAELVDETVMIIDKTADEKDEESQSFIRGDVGKANSTLSSLYDENRQDEIAAERVKPG